MAIKPHLKKKSYL